MNEMLFNGDTLPVLRLLGKGKGGYAYLVERDGQRYVLKQIHHEPCEYYNFGDKLQSELNDYQRLLDMGIPIPKIIDVDREGERILKAYIDGPTIMQLLKAGQDVARYLPAVRQMAEKAEAHGKNIDYFPTNFVAAGNGLWYIDYECNDYMYEWSFEVWGVKYWSHTPTLKEWLRQNEV